MADTGGGHLGQHALQRQGIRRGMQPRRGIGPLDPGGADIDRLMAQKRPDLARKAGDTGLAIGAGDRHDTVRLGREPQGCRMRKRRARIFDDHKGDGRCCQDISGKCCPRAICQDRSSTVLQSCLDKGRAMGLRAGECRKQGTTDNLATIERQPCDSRIATRAWRQTKIRKLPCQRRHSPTPCAFTLNCSIAHPRGPVQSRAANPKAARCGE